MTFFFLSTLSSDPGRKEMNYANSSDRCLWNCKPPRHWELHNVLRVGSRCWFIGADSWLCILMLLLRIYQLRQAIIKVTSKEAVVSYCADLDLVLATSGVIKPCFLTWSAMRSGRGKEVIQSLDSLLHMQFRHTRRREWCTDLSNLAVLSFWGDCDQSWCTMCNSREICHKQA